MDNQDGLSVELLVTHVRERRSLWHPQQQNIPGIKKTQQRMWSEVAQLHNSSIVDIKKKWRLLRSGFTKQINKIPRNQHNKFIINPENYNCKWQYYQLLLFLIKPNDLAEPVTKREKRRPDDDDDFEAPKKRLRINVSNVQSAGDVKQMSQNSSNSMDNGGIRHTEQSLNTSNSNHDLSNGVDEESGSSVAEVLDTPELHFNFDSDYHFLLSFYEYLRPLTSTQKLNIRLALSKAFNAILANEI